MHKHNLICIWLKSDESQEEIMDSKEMFLLCNLSIKIRNSQTIFLLFIILFLNHIKKKQQTFRDSHWGPWVPAALMWPTVDIAKVAFLSVLCFILNKVSSLLYSLYLSFTLLQVTFDVICLRPKETHYSWYFRVQQLLIKLRSSHNSRFSHTVSL